MIDDDDVDMMILSAPTNGGWVGGLIVLVAVLFLALLAHLDREECGRRACVRGEPMVVNHECFCVETAR